jgi:CheY-like chemotaxis protein
VNKTINILIVDDDPMVVRLFTLILSREGYVVHGATSGAQALALLGKQPIDIMLTDYSMPEMNGVELIRETRKAYPNLIIFMVTAYSSEYLGKYGSEEGVQKVLAKPVSRDSLLSHLSTAIST